MAINTLVITLNGNWQQLSSLASVDKANRISFQAHTANSNPIYIAGSDGATADEWGERIPAPSSSEPAAPLVYGENTSRTFYDLAHFYVKGTNNEKLRCNIVTYP